MDRTNNSDISSDGGLCPYKTNSWCSNSTVKDTAFSDDSALLPKTHGFADYSLESSVPALCQYSYHSVPRKQRFKTSSIHIDSDGSTWTPRSLQFADEHSLGTDDALNTVTHLKTQDYLLYGFYRKILPQRLGMVSNRLNRLKSPLFFLIFMLLALALHKVVSALPYSSHYALTVVGSTSVDTLEVEVWSQWREKHYLIVNVMEAWKELFHCRFIGDHSAVLMNKEGVERRKESTRTWVFTLILTSSGRPVTVVCSRISQHLCFLHAVD